MIVNVLAWIGGAFLASLAAAAVYVAIRKVQNRCYYARLEREQASDGAALRNGLHLVADPIEPADHLDDIKDRIREENW